ncbi:hypothetical protein [Pseudoxanthomonas koreensis]|nr:hypothetical protein [Pseudoxanthomonas koreensis]
MTTPQPAKPKTHPWRVFAPGQLSSDYARSQQVIPSHARTVRR